MTLREYIGAPRRMFRRVREKYVERMFILDERVGPLSNMSGFPPQAPPPHHFGANHSTIDHGNFTHKERVLDRIASERITTNMDKEFDLSGLDEVQHCYSSLGLGRVATIDEDKCYEFYEEINIRIPLYISRSKSRAIGRRGIGGYY